MNLAFSKPITPPEFLDCEEEQPLRFEFDGFPPLATTGATMGSAENSGISLRCPLWRGTVRA